MSTLKSFIKSVRAAKTIADERAVIQKESAAIRTTFREEPSGSVRQQNVLKLLYLFTLGERTHFGQIECVKLLASHRFADKRLGYLGTMLLLDENQEVLTLVTNSLQNDLSHSNQNIVGLALCTLGNIASAEMARDLFQEVEKLLGASNSYIRRKAALCAMRIIRKVPDLQPNFLDRTKTLLSDRNHGVMICGITLLTDICENDPDVTTQIRTYVPILVKTLKTLANAGYEPEHDVTGIADPFLQVKILRLFRVLGMGDARTSEQINDILAQVATNTESSKNVGNSILYEAVLTILDIEADTPLRVMGINILGKFLANRDNNIRYVALNTLNKVVSLEPNAVQRQRNTILECLRDPDISIRRRALDLSFALINSENVRPLIRELLAFLEIADTEFKLAMTSQICIAADRYAPNKRWHVDTVLRVLKLAGGYVREEILSSFIRLVGLTPELQMYTTQKLYASLREDITQEGLTMAGVWCIGEYGEQLLKGGNYEEEELVREVKETDIVELLDTIRTSIYATSVINEYLLNAFIKLTSRFQDGAQINRIRSILSQNTSNLNVEIQQRAVEYDNLFQFDDIRKGVVERMPAPEIREENRVLGETTPAKRARGAGRRNAPAVKTSASRDLLDILGGGDESVDAGGGGLGLGGTEKNAELLKDLFGAGPAVNGGGAAPQPGPARSNVADILDLFGSSNTGIAAAAASPPPAVGTTGSMSVLDDIFGRTPAAAAATSPPQRHQFPPVVAYSKNDLTVSLQPTRTGPTTVAIIATFRNDSIATTFDKVNMQVAVPKSQKLTLLPISSPTIAVGEESSQNLRISTTAAAAVRLRLKVTYTKDGREIVDLVNFDRFPSDLLA